MGLDSSAAGVLQIIMAFKIVHYFTFNLIFFSSPFPERHWVEIDQRVQSFVRDTCTWIRVTPTSPFVAIWLSVLG